MRQRSCLGLLACLAALVPISASAFCGFYVGGGGAKLFNNATQTVMMRGGTKTVLSMQNNYQGPPESFAMVVPVPVILKKEDVLTIDPALFDVIDQLDAPRLVEYWEQDPCYKPPRAPIEFRRRSNKSRPADQYSASPPPRDYQVTVEAQFIVGEYEIVILSAEDALGLDAWLRDNNYNIPEGAEEALQPYVQSGMKFFVAKVDIKKVKESTDGRITLSPLRFAYDAESFSLPVRLGLLNSAGTQDLIVHIIAADRYEVANFKNVFVPTNIDVVEGTENEFGAFYASLFDETLTQNPGAVVTEYAWQANTCDPCAVQPLDEQQLQILGTDTIPREDLLYHAKGAVLTRLHVRYTKDSLGEDLIFKRADPIVGGRERNNASGLEKGATKSEDNNFQARYAIRHPWTGPIKCSNPQRGVWGAPPGGEKPKVKPAKDVAFAKRGVQLGAYLQQEIPELKVKPAKPIPGAQGKTRVRMCAVDPSSGGELAVFMLLGFVAMLRSRRAR